jgi:hypothetical protein
LWERSIQREVPYYNKVWPSIYYCRRSKEVRGNKVTELKPGRELDALVAENVMKANKFEGQFIKKVDIETKVIIIGTEWTYPCYSTNIAAAWEVVEKCPLFNLTHGENNWVCRIGLTSKEERAFGSEETITEIKAYGESAPHAICLAALDAVGME